MFRENRRCLWVISSALCFAATLGLRAQRPQFDLLNASVADVQAAVKSGALTYEKLVQLYLNRIAAYDKQGPRLNAVIQINSRAIETARALDEERRLKACGVLFMAFPWP